MNKIDADHAVRFVEDERTVADAAAKLLFLLDDIANYHLAAERLAGDDEEKLRIAVEAQYAQIFWQNHCYALARLAKVDIDQLYARVQVLKAARDV